MQKEQKVQKQPIKSAKKKTNLLHYLLVYLMCLLAACITWLLVRYSMREETRANELICMTGAVDICDYPTGADLYV